ncbi:MAG: response regulator transcription factor [Methylotenera sp.]|nr:response regulator transcription factor [Oligoflexia bacterium]
MVEDEADVRELMHLHLKRDGLQCVAVEDGEKALEILRQESFDLLVLDWMLPGVSGLEICKWAHAQKNGTPILMVTARADTPDIVRGLDAGADDYVTKPFDVPVFLARVRALIRRRTAATRAATLPVPSFSRLKVGELSLNSETYQVHCRNVEVLLTPSEFKLLLALMENQGRVLSREKLIDCIQGEGVSVVDRAVDTHVFGLRKKLGDCSDFIETIRGVGYRVKMDESPHAQS